MGIPRSERRSIPRQRQGRHHPLVLLIMASSQPQVKTEPTNEAANIISALGKAFKGQNGAPWTGDQLAQWLHQNMAQLTLLAKDGKLTQSQILAVRNRCRFSSFREPRSVSTVTGSPSLLSFVSS